MGAMWNPSIRNKDRENFMAGWLVRLSGITELVVSAFSKRLVLFPNH